MDKLPKWRFPRSLPAFQDMESVTVLEAVYTLYSLMNDLVDEWNNFDDDLQEMYETFTSGINTDNAQFRETVMHLVQNFMDTINSKIQQQDKDIADTVTYFNDGIVEAVTGIMDQKFADGSIQLTIHYNEVNEALSISGVETDDIDVVYDEQGESLNHM